MARGLAANEPRWEKSSIDLGQEPIGVGDF